MKNLIYLLILFFSIAIFFIFNFGLSFAKSQGNKIDTHSVKKVAMEYLETIQKHSNTLWITGTIDNPKKLYNFLGNLTAYLFQLTLPRLKAQVLHLTV